MFWTIFLAVFLALCMYKLVEESNPLVWLLKIPFREGKHGEIYWRRGFKGFALIGGLFATILILSLLR